jgi:23S rRNA (uracil1939-C5)-methyltransferase
VQGNALVNRALVRRVAQWAQLGERGDVLDAFCGLGNFSLALARAGAKVLGVEVDRGMVERARMNAAASGIESAEFVVRDLESNEAALPRRPFALAVLDPPRSGAPALVAALAKRRVPELIYACCMPSALGRDARVLADAGYTLDRLTVVDMFPQTSHIETLARFVAR